MGFAGRRAAAVARTELSVPLPYQVYLRQTVIEFLEPLDYWERLRVLDFCERLGQQPFRDGDFTERGADGRDVQVAILGPYALVWWVDSAVCEVKVVTLRPADI